MCHGWTIAIILKNLDGLKISFLGFRVIAHSTLGMCDLGSYSRYHALVTNLFEYPESFLEVTLSKFVATLIPRAYAHPKIEKTRPNRYGSILPESLSQGRILFSLLKITMDGFPPRQIAI